MARTCVRACSLSAIPGNRRRNSMAADNSPSCSKMVRIAAASDSETTNISRAWGRGLWLASGGVAALLRCKYFGPPNRRQTSWKRAVSITLSKRGVQQVGRVGCADWRASPEAPDRSGSKNDEGLKAATATSLMEPCRESRPFSLRRTVCRAASDTGMVVALQAVILVQDESADGNLAMAAVSL